MNDLPATRRYDEKEVRRLLERAAELHGTGVGLGALGSLTLGLGIPALAVGGSYAVCRKVFGTFVARRRRVLARLLEDLTTRLGS